MIAIHTNKLYDQINNFEDRINRHIVDVRKKINTWLKHPKLKLKNGTEVNLSLNQKRYLIFLGGRLAQIVKADYDALIKFQKKIDNIIDPDERKDKSKYFVPFKDALLSITQYSDLRSKYTAKSNPLFVDFYESLGIKACSYCNSQLTIVTDEAAGRPIAKFQVDHYIDKGSYPCFSISFFNLYPVCASCNNKKGSKEVDFKLYSSSKADLSKSAFQFSIDRKSIAQFRTSGDERLLQIKFDDKTSKLNEVFSIEGIYRTQQDLAAEIILKAEMYNESYKQSLRDAFQSLYGKKTEQFINFNRIILGNYSNEKDIHKRPMSKFTQDIARQLRLI